MSPRQVAAPIFGARGSWLLLAPTTVKSVLLGFPAFVFLYGRGLSLNLGFSQPKIGCRHCRPGDDGIRTHDPLLAGQVLSQLSYTPVCVFSVSLLTEN